MLRPHQPTIRPTHKPTNPPTHQPTNPQTHKPTNRPATTLEPFGPGILEWAAVPRNISEKERCRLPRRLAAGLFFPVPWSSAASSPSFSMRYLPVHWFEGMFLRPHQFQAADRHWEECLATSGRWDNPYNYGIGHIDLSPEALANYQVQVAGLRARMQDGTLFSLEVGQQLDRVDLKPAFESTSEVTVMLAIPKFVLGRANVGPESEVDAAPRYAAIDMPLQDASTGGNDQQVGLLALSARIMLSTQDTQGFETLPLARIKRSGADEATPQLDDDYFPPLLAVSAWSPLAIDTIRAIYDIIGEKIDVLAGRVTDRGVTLASSDPGDLDDLLMLITLNESMALLHCITFAQGVHPFVAYYELCRVVVSAFDLRPRAACGRHTCLRSRRSWPNLQVGPDSNRTLARFAEEDAVRAAVLHGDRAGCRSTSTRNGCTPTGIGTSASTPRTSPTWSAAICFIPGKLDWKMGSSEQVDLIFKHGIPGVAQKSCNVAPAGSADASGLGVFRGHSGRQCLEGCARDPEPGLAVSHGTAGESGPVTRTT